MNSLLDFQTEGPGFDQENGGKIAIKTYFHFSRYKSMATKPHEQ